MKRFIKLFFILNVIFAFTSCTFFYGKDADLSYQSMFDLLWEDYNETYALFEVRNVDWNAQYNLCKPMVREDMTDAEFFEVLKTLLYPLNDAHVYVKTPFASLNSGEDQTPIDKFSLTEVCSQYIQNPKKCGNNVITYGTLKTDNTVGYIHIAAFSSGQTGINQKQDPRPSRRASPRRNRGSSRCPPRKRPTSCSSRASSSGCRPCTWSPARRSL